MDGKRWLGNVASIGSSVSGLFRRQKRQRSSVDPASPFEDVSSNIDTDFCEIENVFGEPAWEKCVQSELPCERRLVRVEDGPTLQINSREMVWDEISRVRTSQARLGCAHLYERAWSSVGNDSGDFSIVQFNTLAEGLSSGSMANPPFLQSNPKDVAEYGGFSSVPHPETVFDFNQRKWRLLEVLLQGSEKGNHAPFDLIALEEVDRYYGFFAPVLRMFGYKGIFVPKTNSPSARNGWYSDGCCLFWRDTEFELVTAVRGNYNVGTQVFLVATLLHKTSKRILVVGVTHLKAQRSTANEAIRCCQVSELLDAIDKTCQRHSAASVLVAGDFNADPPHEVEALESAIDRVSKKLVSAYDYDNSSFYTTCKLRANKETKRTIDYIFYDDSSLSCISTLDVPNEDELERSKLPGIRFPSDHLHIAAKFRFCSPAAP